MILFYTENIEGKEAWLEQDEARHCVQVLRKREGDPIVFVDGHGGFYRGVIVETGKKTCKIEIKERQLDFQRRGFKLHIGIAPTKNITRFEWFLEKATEIGIDEITPLYCQHSERKHIRTDRLNKILISAMKQSIKAYLPLLNEMTDLSTFLTAQASALENGFIAHCQEGVKPHLKDNYQAAQNVTILIGPEGDFSEREIGLALEAGFMAVSLGKNRLRTETAGVVACHAIQLMNE